MKIDIIDGQINLGLDLDLDLESQKETKAHDCLRVYKLKVATRFEHIIFGFYILQVANFLLLWLFPLFYGLSILLLTIYKYIILNGFS